MCCRTIIHRRKELLLIFMMFVLVHILFDDDDEIPPPPDTPISNSLNAPSGERIKFDPRLDLNVTTTEQRPKILVYNRVPKCGSQTLSMLINQLSRKNGFLSKAVFQAGEKPERSTSGKCLI